MQPHALYAPMPYVPTPSKSNELRTSLPPSPLTKICALTVPLMSPAVVTCMNKTRPSASGKPFGVPFNTGRPPVVVHDNVLSRNGLTGSKGIDPRLSRALHRADGYFVANVLAVDANGDPAVGGEVREERDERGVDAAGHRASKLAVVEPVDVVKPKASRSLP